MAKMMRLTYYAAASVAAATGVVLKAFHDRPNFYSATIQLSQSPISYGILLNLLLLSFGTLVYGVQLLLFGSLRLIERERLYERSWISITETLLIMMTFRDDISFHFLFLLSNLIVVRMWSWLNEGRIEMLEQQPPTNPRRFHARLSASLAMTIMLDASFLKHCIDTVLNDARPGMMVMYAFEFAVLGISCISAMLRYFLALYEIRVVSTQTQGLVDARKQQLQQELDTARTQAREAGQDEDEAIRSMARPEDVDENEVEAAGWEAKGQWVFVLDISTDFLRLVVYLAFFTLLLLFHGLPIHILRDVYITLHSFLKRIHSYIQYRNATKDMNAKFPDANAEELANENTCIVCREDMRVWSELDEHGNQNDQRLRPKKLPCGHILHFNCLRSWLERQQVCPTCRRSVLASTPTSTSSRRNAAPGQQHQRQHPVVNPQQVVQQPLRRDEPQINELPNPLAALGLNQPNHAHGPVPNENHVPAQPQELEPQPQQRRRHRVDFTVPFLGHRVVLDWGNVDIGELQQLQTRSSNPTAIQPTGTNIENPSSGSLAPGLPTQADLIAYERAISRELLLLNLNQAQLGHLRSMQQNLTALRRQAAQAQFQWEAPFVSTTQAQQPGPAVSSANNAAQLNEGGPSNIPPSTVPEVTTRIENSTPANPATDASIALPPGMVLPEGWTLVPLTQTAVQPERSSSTHLPSMPPMPAHPGGFMPPGHMHFPPAFNGPMPFGIPGFPSYTPQGAAATANFGHVQQGQNSSTSQTPSRPSSARDPYRADGVLATYLERSNATGSGNADQVAPAAHGQGNADATTSTPVHDGAHNTLPAWNFGDLPAQNSTSRADSSPATSRNLPRSNGTADADGSTSIQDRSGPSGSAAHEGKGKGRAVTVEDGPEEPVD